MREQFLAIQVKVIYRMPYVYPQTHTSQKNKMMRHAQTIGVDGYTNYSAHAGNDVSIITCVGTNAVYADMTDRARRPLCVDSAVYHWKLQEISPFAC